MTNKFQKRKNKAKSSALEQIKELFNHAESAKNQKLANRYVSLASKISSRTKVKIPLQLKRRFCKKCKSHLRVGTTQRVRLTRGKKTYTCNICQHVVRVPYK